MSVALASAAIARTELSPAIIPQAATAIATGQNTASDIERFYYSALQTSAAGVIVVGCAGEILHINPEARQLLRRPQADAGDLFYSLFIDDKSFDGIVDVVFAGLSTPESLHTGHVTLKRGDELAHLDIKVSKFRNENGVLRGVVVVINDVTHQHMRATFASIFASGVAVVFFYVSLLSVFSELMRTTQTRTLMNSLLMLLPAAGSFYIAAKCGLPLEMLGVSTRNWRIHAREAVYFSVLLCFALTAAMFAFQSVSPTLAQLHVFNFSADDLTSLPFFLGIALYIALTPLQEFLARGTLQAPLEQVFTGRYRLWTANIIANLMFSVFHQHLGLIFSIMVLVPGLFWGWLFSRQKTLVGVSISHAIVGTYVLTFLNLHAFLSALF